MRAAIYEDLPDGRLLPPTKWDYADGEDEPK